MKKYLEENIKFDSIKFTSGFYASVLAMGGEIGLIINGNLKESKVVITLFGGILLIIFAISYLFYLNGRIQNNISKLKNYE